MRLFACSTFLILSLATVHAADVPEIPAEKRKQLVDAILAKSPKQVDLLNAKLKAVAAAKVDPKLKANEIPDDPEAAPSFPSKAAKDMHRRQLMLDLEQAKADAKLFLKNPLLVAPALESFDKGNFGTINSAAFRKVSDVIDANQVVVTFSAPSPVGPARLTNVLFTGIETDNLADGKPIALPDIYYVVGNAKVNGSTVMQLVPFRFTDTEKMRLGSVELKAEKKK